MSSKSKPEKPEEVSTPIDVDAIETAEEVALKDQALARKIINRAATLEGDINLAMMAVNVKKLYIGCLLLISRRLANSGETEDETKTAGKVKNSLFDKLIDAKMLSRATAYRRIADARVFIEAGIISSEMLDQIEKSEVASPELIATFDKRLRTPRGMKLQQKHGLLPNPQSGKASKSPKTAKEKLVEGKKRFEAILEGMSKVIKSEEFEKECADARELEIYRTGFHQMEIGIQTLGSYKLLKNKPAETKLEGLMEQSLTNLPGNRVTIST